MNNKNKKYQNKLVFDNIVKIIFLFTTIIAASVIIVATLFIVYKGAKPFIHNYGTKSNPIRADLGYFFIGKYTVSGHRYGAGFIFVNTLLITVVALAIAAPISIFSSLYITRVAKKGVKTFLEVTIELLSAIPSVIYGLFGYAFINRITKRLANLFGYQTAGGNSLLSGAFVLAIMIIPTITLLSVTAIKSVKPDVIHASLALGATEQQTNFKIVLRSVRGPIFQAIIIGIGRAFGEATAVSMVVGNASSGPTFNIFNITSTLTTRMLLGLHESVGLAYDIRFSVGILLMMLILFVNVLLQIVKKKLTEGKSKKRKIPKRKKNKTVEVQKNE